MTRRRREGLLGVAAASARTDHRLVAMEVDLGLQLVPQLVVGRSFHVPTQQLDLLDSETRVKEVYIRDIRLGLSGQLQAVFTPTHAKQSFKTRVWFYRKPVLHHMFAEEISKRPVFVLPPISVSFLSMRSSSEQ